MVSKRDVRVLASTYQGKGAGILKGCLQKKRGQRAIGKETQRGKEIKREIFREREKWREGQKHKQEIGKNQM